MPIVPLLDLTAMPNGRDTKALTTSFARSETLPVEGYKFVRVSEFVVTAQGKPTTHRRRGTGEIYIDPHGPYTIDTRARTCTCQAFANRSGCPHLPYAMRWLDAWNKGESLTVRLVTLSRELIALKEIEGSRYQCEAGRIVVFRDWEAAGAYWEANGLVEHCELKELRSCDLEELAATGKYAGLALQTAEGVQPIPLPEVDWSARAARGGAIKREDFD